MAQEGAQAMAQAASKQKHVRDKKEIVGGGMELGRSTLRVAHVQNGFNLGLRMKHFFQALFLFLLHVKGPISLENRFGPDLDTPSSML